MMKVSFGRISCFVRVLGVSMRFPEIEVLFVCLFTVLWPAQEFLTFMVPAKGCKIQVYMYAHPLSRERSLSRHI
jgi:hypothetical protein